jgi:hypothetical protein
MSRQDFELMAEVIRKIKPQKARSEAAKRAASMCAYVNPRFDKVRFFAACGL